MSAITRSYSANLLSYRHSYHAGNHADVLKHSVMSLIIEKLKEKNKPFVFIDTHSGAGMYDLTTEQALKRSEFKTGIGKLLPGKSQFPELKDYFDLIMKLNPENHLRWYPGSPRLAAHLLRKQDRIILMELHNTEIDNLQKNMRGDVRIEIHHRNGFEGLVGILPPIPARGLVLIDPAYEVKEDYQQVVTSVQEASLRWPTGIYVIWYPILSAQRDRSSVMLQRLGKCDFKNLLVAELSVREQQQDVGMHGSGMVIINAPWQLDQRLTTLLPRLSHHLAQDTSARWMLEWRIESA